MVRYRYVSDFSPPAPFVHVILGNPSSEHRSKELPAQLDSAADRTVIPSRVAEELELIPVRQITVAGLGGSLHTLDEFIVLIQIRHLLSVAVTVLAHAGETFVLLGRDVLNHYRIVMDGPGQVVDIE